MQDRGAFVRRCFAFADRDCDGTTCGASVCLDTAGSSGGSPFLRVEIVYVAIGHILDQRGTLMCAAIPAGLLSGHEIKCGVAAALGIRPSKAPPAACKARARHVSVLTHANASCAQLMIAQLFGADNDVVNR